MPPIQCSDCKDAADLEAGSWSGVAHSATAVEQREAGAGEKGVRAGRDRVQAAEKGDRLLWCPCMLQLELPTLHSKGVLALCCSLALLPVTVLCTAWREVLPTLQRCLRLVRRGPRR